MVFSLKKTKLKKKTIYILLEIFRSQEKKEEKKKQIWIVVNHKEIYVYKDHSINSLVYINYAFSFFTSLSIDQSNQIKSNQIPI